MKQRNLFLLGVLVVAALALAACSGTSVGAAEKVSPSQVEKIEGSEFSRVILTEKAAQRLDLQTIAVRDEEMDGAQRLVVPYAAVIYGLEGETWAYTNPEPLVFVRQPITVEYIDGNIAVLSDGPAAGTAVVTVGVAELYGAETGVSK